MGQPSEFCDKLRASRNDMEARVDFSLRRALSIR
jgi:hypothetical protein